LDGLVDRGEEGLLRTDVVNGNLGGRGGLRAAGRHVLMGSGYGQGLGFGRAVCSASDMVAGVPWSGPPAGLQTSRRCLSMAGLRKITTHRSAYENLAGWSIAVPVCILASYLAFTPLSP